VVVVVACAFMTAACGSASSPGQVSHPPFDLPSETGATGVYLRDCLAPGTGLVTGTDEPRRIASGNVAVIIRCEPDPGHDAVRVSTATGDPAALLSAMTSRPSASSTGGGKATVFVVLMNDSNRVILTATGIPASAVDDAKFQFIGTTPSGSL
jgi:hypothetical protein